MKKSIWLILMLALCLAGCTREEKQQEAEQSSPTITESATEDTNSNTNVVTDVLAPLGQGKEQEKQVSGLKEVLEKKEVANVELSNAINRMIDQEMDSEGSMFCVDEDTGVIYFVNRNKDHYLYRLKDGEVALAVEMPVREVYCYQEDVYFVIDTYGKYELTDMKEGEIYCYSPADGSVRLIYSPEGMEAMDSVKMKVTEEGIYVLYSVLNSVVYEGKSYSSLQGWYLPHGAETPEKDTQFWAEEGWKNYRLMYIATSADAQAEFCLVDRTGSGEIRSLGFAANQYCIVGDWIYYIAYNSYKVTLVHLETGETIEYDFQESMEFTKWLDTGDKKKEEMAAGENLQLIQSFAVTDNGKYLWIADSIYFFRMDLESGETTMFATDDKQRRIDRLYTDGENLYAMYTPTFGGATSMVRVTETDRYNELGSCLVVDIEYLTK